MAIQLFTIAAENENKSDKFLCDTGNDIEVEVEELVPIKINSFSLYDFETNNTLDKEINSIETVPLSFQEATAPQSFDWETCH